MKENSTAVPVTQTDELKRNLRRMNLVPTAMGQIISAGIMTMIDTAIGMIRRNVNIAFITAGILCISTAILQILVGGTACLKGGQYTQVAAFGGQRLVGIFTMVNVLMGLGITMCMIPFTEYLLALVPNAPAKLIVVMTIILISGLNILGTKQTAALQAVMCVVMALAIGAFVTPGIPDLQPSCFVPPDFITKGFTGILMISVYLSSAAGGAQYVVNFSGEVKNLKKGVSLAIIVPTAGISLIYAVMGIIVAGVLPVAEVVNKNLALVAEAIMSRPVYVFFIVGGAMSVLLTTLNASIGWICRPVAQAVKDSWLPGFFGKINGKFGTPVNVFLLFYIIGPVPISMRLNISTVSNAMVILMAVMKMIPCFMALRLPSVMSELWNKSKFHVSQELLNTFYTVGRLVATFQMILLLVTSVEVEIVGSVIILAVAVIYALAVNSKVKMKVSYGDCG